MSILLYFIFDDSARCCIHSFSFVISIHYQELESKRCHCHSTVHLDSRKTWNWSPHVQEVNIGDVCFTFHPALFFQSCIT